MQTRLDYGKAAPGAVQEPQKCVEESGLEHSLLELVKTRVSQMNGCAFCIDMHTKDARAAGETEQRLYGLSAWHEAPYYSEREPLTHSEGRKGGQHENVSNYGSSDADRRLRFSAAHDAGAAGWNQTNRPAAARSQRPRTGDCPGARRLRPWICLPESIPIRAKISSKPSKA